MGYDCQIGQSGGWWKGVCCLFSARLGIFADNHRNAILCDLVTLKYTQFSRIESIRLFIVRVMRSEKYLILDLILVTGSILQQPAPPRTMLLLRPT